jgi:hypothetical protein
MNWWLIFERLPAGRSPGATETAGLFGGSRQDPPQYRTFKCLLVIEAPDWKAAINEAIKLTGRLGAFAAVRCDVFIPDMLNVE